MPCDYCGRDDCGRCVRRLQMDVLEVMNRLEQELLKPDRTDDHPANAHLRAAWRARDAINALLAPPEPADAGG